MYSLQKLVSRGSLPLLGKRILLTTPRNYAAPLAEMLVTRGAHPIWMPANEIWPLDDYSELDRAISEADSYAWVAFTSENGIEAFIDRAAVAGLTAGKFRNTRLAAFKWDARLLEAHGFSVDLVPPESSTVGITVELKRRGVRSGRVLVPVPDVVGVPEPSIIPLFIQELAAIGLNPHRVPAYKTVASVENAEVEKKLLISGAIDVVVVTSSAEIYSLLAFLGPDRAVLERVAMAYMGKLILDTAQASGLRLDIVQKEYTFRSLVEAIEDHFRVKK